MVGVGRGRDEHCCVTGCLLSSLSSVTSVGVGATLGMLWTGLMLF